MRLRKRVIKAAMKQAFYSYGAVGALGVMPEEQAQFFYSNIEDEYEEAAEWWKENYPVEDYSPYGEVLPEGPVFEMCLECYEDAANMVSRVFFG